MRNHSHLSIEKVAASEVHECEGILLDRIVFDIDSMVFTFEEADAHISWVVASVEEPRLW